MSGWSSFWASLEQQAVPQVRARLDGLGWELHLLREQPRWGAYRRADSRGEPGWIDTGVMVGPFGDADALLAAVERKEHLRRTCPFKADGCRGECLHCSDEIEDPESAP